MPGCILSARHTLFPLGEMKSRKCGGSRRNALSIAEKRIRPESVLSASATSREFLKNYLPAKSGKIVDVISRRVLGGHEGVLYYTIGQRKGLGIGGEGGPWFVVGKDVVHNELLVASGESNDWLLSDTCLVSGVNWLARTKPQGALSCCAKFRYRQKDNPVTLEFLDETNCQTDLSPAGRFGDPGAAGGLLSGRAVPGRGCDRGSLASRTIADGPDPQL